MPLRGARRRRADGTVPTADPPVAPRPEGVEEGHRDPDDEGTRAPWRICGGPLELDGDARCPEAERWVWIVTRDGVTRTVLVVADEDAIWARRTGRGPRAVRDAVAARGSTAVTDAVRTRDEPPSEILITGSQVLVRDDPTGGRLHG